VWVSSDGQQPLRIRRLAEINVRFGKRCPIQNSVHECKESPSEHVLITLWCNRFPAESVKSGSKKASDPSAKWLMQVPNTSKAESTLICQ
jgi:hypothetical protein